MTSHSCTTTDRSYRRSQPHRSPNTEHVLDNIQLNYNAHNTYTLPATCIDNLTHLTDFNYITQGLSANSSTLNAHVENIVECARYWAEQCDTVSGFHIYMDVDSGWAGVACSVIQALRDEFGANVPLIVFGICDKLNAQHIDYPKHMTRRLINRCVTLSTIHEQAALFVPFDGDTIDLTHNTNMSQYEYIVHLFASTIHNMTLPYRVQRNFCSIHSYITHLTPLSRLNIVGVNTIVPLPVDNPLLTQRQTRSLQTDTRSAAISHTSFTALWKPSNPAVQVMSPFSQRIERGEQRKQSRRNARLIDEDDSDLDSDSDLDTPPTEVLLSEIVVCRGLNDEQQMNLTINYNTLAPSGNREYSYVIVPTQSPHSNKRELVPAVYDVYNTQLIGRWLQHNSDALAGILGSSTVQNVQGSDTVDVRQIIQQYSKDGMSRSDLLEIVADIRSLADAYMGLDRVM